MPVPLSNALKTDDCGWSWVSSKNDVLYGDARLHCPGLGEINKTDSSQCESLYLVVAVQLKTRNENMQLFYKMWQKERSFSMAVPYRGSHSVFKKCQGEA